MNIKSITNKYPVVNDEWDYRCMPPDWGKYRLDLNSYLRDVLYGHSTKNVITYKSGDYVGVTEFFERHSTRDDFYDNPAVFTHKGNDIFNYSGNSDPWGRMFKAYKNGISNGIYRCRAILEDGNKPMVYVLSTSVEGHTVYCIDRINI
jgi:hypothetical protein